MASKDGLGLSKKQKEYLDSQNTEASAVVGETTELREGNGVIIKTGAATGKRARVLRIVATQDTLRGRSQTHCYLTDGGNEYYRRQDLQKA